MPGKPTIARFYAVLALLLASATAQAVEGLNEQIVVDRTLKRTALVDTIAGETQAQAGRARVVGADPNPQLTYLREQTSGPQGTAEDYLSIAQTIDLGDRRLLHREAGELRATAAAHEGDATRLEVAADACLRFHDVLYRQQRALALTQWLTRIEEALAIVARREQRGDAARYDRRRLEREREVAKARTTVEQALLDRSRARVAALIGETSDDLVAVGELLPASDPPDLASLESQAESRPDLRALDVRLQATAQDVKAAGRWWLPDLRLEGGWKGVRFNGQGRSDGFLGSAMLSLPLWDRSGGLAMTAEGEARVARGRRALITTALVNELAGARLEAVRLRAAAIDFGARSATGATDLVRMASVGYEGGELGLLELLDAYRGAADDAVTTLDMMYAARRARIELDRMTGAALP